VNDELKEYGEWRSWSCSRYYPSLLLERRREAQKTPHLTNMEECYLLSVTRPLVPSATATIPVRAQVRSRGICGGQSGTGAGFIRVFRFSLPILISLTAPHSSSIIQGWYSRPISGRRTKWTQSHPTPRNLKKTTKKQNKLRQ
jgi:hypothetical protein